MAACEPKQGSSKMLLEKIIFLTFEKIRVQLESMRKPNEKTKMESMRKQKIIAGKEEIAEKIRKEP